VAARGLEGRRFDARRRTKYADVDDVNYRNINILQLVSQADLAAPVPVRIKEQWNDGRAYTCAFAYV
jgi:hypothetical protein